MSRLTDAVNALRRELLQGNSRAAADLFNAHKVAFNATQAQLDRLLKAMAEAKANGAVISQAWLFRQQRLEELQAQASAEMAVFARLAEQRVTSEQQNAVVRSQDDTKQLAFAALEDAGRVMPAITTNWNRLPVESLTDLVGALQDGSPLRRLFDDFGSQASEGMRKALIAGIATGASPRDIGRQIRQVLDIGLTRAQTIARTETLRAYRSASLRTYEENADVVSGWRWMASLSPRTCRVCLAMHGKVFPLTTPFGSHVNCFPSGTVIQTPPVQASTSRWYEGEIIDVETVSGNLFSVTPNHPILTSQGWIAAGLLNEGGDVIRAINANSILHSVNPYYNNVPTRIEEVAKTFRGASGMVSVTMPTSAENFHGDGEGSQIHIVRANRLLRDAFNTPLLKPFLEEQFIRRNMSLLSLSRLCASHHSFDSIFASSSGSLSRLHVLNILLSRSLLHHQSVSFNTISHGNIILKQYSPNYIARYVEIISDAIFRLAALVRSNNQRFIHIKPDTIVPKRNSLLNENAFDYFVGDTISASEFLTAFAGQVTTDKIIHIRRRPFSGHVYNLQTSEGWYIANNIISHNCRCAVVPVVEGAPPLRSGEDWLQAQSAETQEAVLGIKAAEAWRKGEVTLEDFIGRSHSERWGEGRFTLSLEEARFKAHLRTS